VGTGGTSVGHVCWPCVGRSATGEKEKVPECLEIEWLPVSRDARGRRVWEQSRALVGSRSEESPGTNVSPGGAVICWLHSAAVVPSGRKEKKFGERKWSWLGSQRQANERSEDAHRIGPAVSA
jgi:hypothetical protein